MIRDEDLATLLLELERRLPRADIAAALGVEERELDEIASGYLPGDDVARRLRALAGTDVEPATVAPRLSRRLIVAFVAADLVFFAGVAVFVLLR